MIQFPESFEMLWFRKRSVCLGQICIKLKVIGVINSSVQAESVTNRFLCSQLFSGVVSFHR